MATLCKRPLEVLPVIAEISKGRFLFDKVAEFVLQSRRVRPTKSPSLSFNLAEFVRLLMPSYFVEGRELLFRKRSVVF